MEGRRNRQLGLSDLTTYRREKKLNQHFLMKVDDIIDWRPIVDMVREIYSEKMGRPGYPPEVMIKVLFLQKWFNMSDPEVEFQIINQIVEKDDPAYLLIKISAISEKPLQPFRIRLLNILFS